MAKRIIFTLFDHDGAPLEDATPTVINYRSSTGAALVPPLVEEMGDGFYQFVAQPEQDGHTAYVIDAGANSSVQYLTGAVGKFIAFGMYDLAGNLDGSRTPGFISYTNGMNELPHPTIVNLSGGLYGFWPEVAAGEIVYYNVGDSDNVFSGTVGSVSLLNPVPLANSAIPNTQPITFDVLDTESELGRVLIGIKYEEFGGATELAWDGEAVCGPFVVSSVPISNGRRYTVLRRMGWPAAPTIRVFLTNYGGREL